MLDSVADTISRRQVGKLTSSAQLLYEFLPHFAADF